MRAHWETIWAFKTSRFEVRCEVTPEDMNPADCFEFEDDIEAVRDGRVDWFTTRVIVLFDGLEIGTDYLGGCACYRASDFVEGQERNGYFRDMVRAAVTDARSFLANVPALRAA